LKAGEQFVTVVPNYTPLGICLLLVAAAVVSVFRGWLITRSQNKREIEVRDAQVLQAYKDRDFWRSAWMAESEARKHADGQVSALLELARLTERTVSQAIQAVPPPRGELPDGSES
jgi:hypothetical protein